MQKLSSLYCSRLIVYPMLDALRSAIIIPLICAFTAVMGTVAMLLSLFDQRGSLQQGCARVWARGVAAMAGMRVRAQGLEHIPLNQPCVFAANHQSYLDIPALLTALPGRLLFLGRPSLFSIPVFGWALRRAGHIPIDREHARAALTNLNRAAEKLQTGYSTVIFPEGTRSSDGALRAFKSGGFKLALKAGVPIVPVTIIGTYEVLRRDSYTFHPGAVEVIIDSPIGTLDQTHRTLPELMERTRARMAARLKRQAAASFDLRDCARVDS
jgi:1-acyl-sn-glycerol-3-phosphate acyltransferase